MASKKKSAIEARQGHPTGIIDDIARPIMQKAANVVIEKTLPRSNSKIANKAYYAARQIEKKVVEKRATSYRNKAQKLYKKADAVESISYWSGQAAQDRYARVLKKKIALRNKAIAKKRGIK